MLNALTAIYSARPYEETVAMLKTLAYGLGIDIEVKVDRKATQADPPLLLEHMQ